MIRKVGTMRSTVFPVICCLGGLLTATLLPATAKPITFVVDDPKHRDLVSFNSDAPIEVIVGHTGNVKGKINLDDSLDLSKTPLSAEFDVDLASIDTGIPLRNEHMRDNFLETKKYPEAVFKVTSLTATPVILQDGKPVKVQAAGQFSLHGKTLKRDIPVEVTFRKVCQSQGKFEKCDLIQVKSKFPIPFKDYGIQRPEVVFQKLADTVFVTVSLTAFREPAAAK